ncbi:MAG: tRNA lysidine(34) synthetase TilS [Dehalococcoidia bacterium]
MNRISLKSRITHFIQQHSLVSPGETVVVAVSGGADSVCLLHVLAKWQKEAGIGLYAAHLDHRLRGVESEADVEYVSNLAESLGIPLTIDRQDVAAYRAQKNSSLEEAARELRYAFLARVAREVGANPVATGHTRDDQVETVLMHILRGAGTGGLGGLAPCSPMPYESETTPSRGKLSNLLIIRPLLDTTREETTSYCQKHGLNPRIDSSNVSLSLFRNRLRLQLLPLLRQYNPSVDRALLRLAEIAREDSAFIQQQASELWDEVARQEDDTIHLDRKQATELPTALQRQLLRVTVARLAGDIRDIEASHIESARGLLSKPVGKSLSMPNGLICYTEYDGLVIARPGPIISGLDLAGAEQYQPSSQCHLPPLAGEVHLKVPGETVLPGWKVIATIFRQPPQEGHYEPRLYGRPEKANRPRKLTQNPPHEPISADFDLHKTGTDLFVRRRHPGDRFQPLGMSMPKRLQDFMVDAKIPRSWRGRIPIVCSPEQIIWVAGCRIDDGVKTTETSRDILHLEFTRS